MQEEEKRSPAMPLPVSLGLEDLKSAIISQSTDTTAVIVTCQCCGSHVYLKPFSTTPLIGRLPATTVAATSNPIYMFNNQQGTSTSENFPLVGALLVFH